MSYETRNAVRRRRVELVGSLSSRPLSLSICQSTNIPTCISSGCITKSVWSMDTG